MLAREITRASLETKLHLVAADFKAKVVLEVIDRQKPPPIVACEKPTLCPKPRAFFPFCEPADPQQARVAKVERLTRQFSLANSSLYGFTPPRIRIANMI